MTTFSDLLQMLQGGQQQQAAPGQAPAVAPVAPVAGAPPAMGAAPGAPAMPNNTLHANPFQNMQAIANGQDNSGAPGTGGKGSPMGMILKLMGV